MNNENAPHTVLFWCPEGRHYALMTLEDADRPCCSEVVAGIDRRQHDVRLAVIAAVFAESLVAGAHVAAQILS